MAAYSSQTVNDLKTLLKARGLPTSGNKSDLIARLEENDHVQEEVKPDAEEKAIETVPESVAVTETETVAKQEETAPAVETATADSSTTTTESKPEEKKEEEKEKKVKELTPEERKAAALELLQKKLKRAIKFGTETEDLKKQIDRVEKFGVELNTSLAREIGITSADRQLSDKKNRPHGHGRRRH